MSTYYGNNDWRDYQSLQHWDWPGGKNSPSYNHAYWLKNKAEILAKRAKKAAKDVKDGLKDRDFHRKAAKRVAEAFGKDHPNVQYHKDKASEPINLSKKEEKPQDKIGTGRKKTYGEGGGNAHITGEAKINDALSKVGNAKVSNRPRGRKKTYGSGGGNASKGASTGSNKKVGNR